MAKCLFLFLPFCFCVYHSPYYILIIWASFIFFTISFITTLCWRRFFVFVPLVLFDLRVRLDIQPQRKNCWLLDMEAGFKISGFNFFLFLLPLIFSLSVNWGCFRFFGFFSLSVYYPLESFSGLFLVSPSSSEGCQNFHRFLFIAF